MIVGSPFPLRTSVASSLKAGEKVAFHEPCFAGEEDRIQKLPDPDAARTVSLYSRIEASQRSSRAAETIMNV